MKLTVKEMILVALMAALTAIGAFIKIPIPPYPVPLTLQTFFVFLCGMLLKPKLAFSSQAIYIVIGLIGIPVFTGGGGLSYVLNPTFGYLVAFAISAPLISIIWRKFYIANKRFVFFITGVFIILLIQVLGVCYVAFIGAVYSGSPLPISKAIYLCYIFLPLDIFKLILGTIIGSQVFNRIKYLI